MNDFILKLENDQHLRILPFENGDLFKVYHEYYFDDIGGFVLDTTTNITFTTQLQRVIRHFFIVEYMGKLHIIKTGRKIRDIIDYYFSDDSGQTFYSPQHLMECSIMLNVKIDMVGPYQNYDKSIVYQLAQSHQYEHIIDDFHNSIEYVDIIKKFDSYIDNRRLENRPKQIELLEANGLFTGNYQYLLRNLKIDRMRENKTNSTKTKLWNQVIKMIGETTYENNRMEDIGYLKSDKDGEEVHQFMVDGYLFEVKLKDKV
jgi:hypothetical protein